MERFDFSRLLYDEANNRESLLRGLDSLVGTGPYGVTIIPYASGQRPTDCFRAPHGNRRRFALIRSKYGVHLFKLVFVPRRKAPREPPVQGNFFVYEHPQFENIFVVLTVEESAFVQRALMPFVEQNYPRVYLPLISQERLSSLLHGFKMRYGYSDLSVVRASLRSRFMGEGQRREVIIPSVSWLNLGLEGAFRYAQEQDGWFSSLTFHALKGDRLCADVTIHRSGLIRSYVEFSNVFESLVLPVCKELWGNLKLFEGRSRRETESLQVRPLTVNFGTDLFVNAEENAKFIEAIRLLDKASASVLHSNPYVHLSLIDYIDGSTFDLWVLNPRELVIVPQLKGTVQAIRRLVSHIFDNYAEGNVVDFQGISR